MEKTPPISVILLFISLSLNYYLQAIIYCWKLLWWDIFELLCKGIKTMIFFLRHSAGYLNELSAFGFHLSKYQIIWAPSDTKQVLHLSKQLFILQNKQNK